MRFDINASKKIAFELALTRKASVKESKKKYSKKERRKNKIRREYYEV